MSKKPRTWVPFDWGLLEDDKFLELSSAASLTFLVAIGYAGKLGSSKGELYIQGCGPARAQHFVRYTKLSKARQERAIEELVGCSLFEIDGELYRIPKWLDKILEIERASNRERQKLFRERERNKNVTPDVTPLSQKSNAKVTVYNAKALQNKGRRARRQGQTLPPDSPQTPLITTPTLLTSSPSETRSSNSGVGSSAPSADATPSWQDALREETREIRKKNLASLTPDERLILGRYHALEFANCTKTEAFNKRHGSQIAGAFASMGRHATYGQITVSQYVAHARRHHANREESPWFDPWQIKAVVEFEDIAAS